jgi:hypothetical protein
LSISNFDGDKDWNPFCYWEWNLLLTTTASSACDVSNTVLQQNMDVTNSDGRTEQMSSQNDVHFTPTKQDLSNGLSFVCVKEDVVSLPVFSFPTLLP